MANRQLFTSRLSLILTMIGVAVGLGNVWRFPYMMGRYGGSAFLLIYLLFTILLAFPAVMAEWGLGRATRQGPLEAFRQTLGARVGKIIGLMLFVTVLVADSYYLVVIANVFFTAGFSAFYGFGSEQMPLFSTQLSNGWLQFAVAVVILALSCFVIYKGLNKGIEPVSRLAVPFFLVVIVYLIFHALNLDGAAAQLMAFLKPNFSALESSHVFAAMGQAFFSLSLGGTFLLIYGSYLPDSEDIPRSAMWMVGGDVGAALLTSLFIVPTILVFGLDMTSGPQLIFTTVPNLFAQMPLGRVLGTCFLLALGMVAFLSNIAALEVLAGSMQDVGWFGGSRRRIVYILGAVECLLMLPSALDPNLIGTLDLIFGSGMQVFGSAITVIAFAWGLSRVDAFRQLFGEAAHQRSSFLIWWLRWVVPIALLGVLGMYIYSSLS